MACQNQIQASEQSQVSVPAEIIVEILLRLPVESLLRCRAVCKLWHSLISDPYFIHSKYLSSTSSSSSSISNIKLIFSNVLRRNISICNISDALYDKSVSNKVLSIDTELEPFFNRDVMIAASCNGLVYFHDEFGHSSFFIWNPTTRICNKLSPGFCFKTYGFGYDKSSDDYKILASSYSLYDNPRTRIYSLNTGKWNTIGNFPRCKPVVANATETYGQVLHPDYDDEDNRYHDMSLGALGEELCMLCYYHERHSDIWVMKVYGVKESWTKLFSIAYMHDGGIIPRYNTPLFISNDGKILFEDHGKLFVYDSKKGSYYEIQNFELYSKACIFVESLVSPMPTPAIP